MAYPIQMGQNLGESNVLADPKLQFPRRDFIGHVATQVGTVHDIKRDNFDPKKEKQMSTLLAVISVALVVLGVLAAVLASATGIGAAVGAVGLLIGLTAYYMRDKAQEKEQKTQDVELVHRDAIAERLGRTIQHFHNVAEGIVPAQYGYENQMARPVAVPRQPAYNPGAVANAW